MVEARDPDDGDVQAVGAEGDSLHGSWDSGLIQELTAQRLPRLAAELFRRKGYAATTTREISRQLGIQKASLYHHIRSKEDLLFGISMDSLEAITKAVDAAAKQASEEDRLEAMVRAHVNAALRDRDMHTTMLVELRALSSARRNEVLKSRDAYEGLLREQIVVEQRAGRLRTDIDAQLMTLSLLNLLNWTIFWFDPEGAHSADEVGAVLATIFLDGARP